MTSVNGDVLNAAFQKVGARYGFDAVTAKFEEFPDVKIRWQRSYRWAEFKVTDFIKDAPESVFDDLADSIFGKIAGQDRGYPESLKAYLLRENFRSEHLPVFLKRHRIEHPDRDLAASLDRLAERELIPADLGITAVWTPDQFMQGIAKSSVIFRTIFVGDEALALSDGALDYIVYCEAVRFLVPFDPDDDQQADADALRASYPEADRWKQEIRDVLCGPECGEVGE